MSLSVSSSLFLNLLLSIVLNHIVMHPFEKKIEHYDFSGSSHMLYGYISEPEEPIRIHSNKTDSTCWLLQHSLYTLIVIPPRRTKIKFTQDKVMKCDVWLWNKELDAVFTVFSTSISMVSASINSHFFSRSCLIKTYLNLLSEIEFNFFLDE